ncbi:unnamed protein product, partial [Prorocentrum cordatum]
AAAACAELERRHREGLALLRADLAAAHGALAAALGARLAQPRAQPRAAAPEGSGGCAPGQPGLLRSGGCAPGQPGLVSSGQPEQAGGAWTEVVSTERPEGSVSGKTEPTCAVHGAGSSEHSYQLPGAVPRMEDKVSAGLGGPSERRPSSGSESTQEHDDDIGTRISQKLFESRGSNFSAEPLSSWRDFVNSSYFEIIVVTCVALNCIFIALELQNEGFKLGHALEYPLYEDPDPWTGASGFFDAMGLLFGVVFAAELILKLMVLRRKFFASWWNGFDLVVFLIWLTETLLSAAGVNPVYLRFARLVRLLRLARFRHINSFDSLFLMYTSLINSRTILFWSCAFLFALQILSALFLSQILHTMYFGNDSNPEAEQQAVFRYFGSFSRAMLSTFQMALSGSFPIYRVLIEHVSEWFIFVCIFYQLTVGLAVVGIINGIFIQETFKAASSDDLIMMHAKESKMRAHRNNMTKLLAAGDMNPENGQLDQAEFIQLMNNDDVKLWLSSLGLDPSDAAALFTLLDADNEGTVSKAELINGIASLQGQARSLDVHLCMRRQSDLIRLLSSIVPERGSQRGGRDHGSRD